MRTSILRQARLAGQAISHTRSSPITSQPHYLPAAFSAPVRSRIAARWYSDEKAKDENLGASGNTGEEPTVQKEGSDAAAANPLQKELDAAKKDVIDLKVSKLRQRFSGHHIHVTIRTSMSGKWRNTATSRSALDEKYRQQRILPYNDSRRISLSQLTPLTLHWALYQRRRLLRLRREQMMLTRTCESYMVASR